MVRQLGWCAVVGRKTEQRGELVSIMRTHSVPEQISHFLSQNANNGYCDACIQEKLRLKRRQQVELVTATLRITGEFDQGIKRCESCGEVKDVTQLSAQVLHFS